MTMGSRTLEMAAGLLAQADNTETPPTLLENIKTIAEIVGTSVTAAALLVGGIWAYFKFVKGRTYRPRLEVGLSGQWRLIGGKDFLQARITVKNIGASVVTLLQKGTGLRVSVLAPDQPMAPASVAWKELMVFEVLADHEWIEPGETVSDDLLLDLGASEPVATLFEARLVWRWSKTGDNIVVSARRVIPVDSTIETHEESAPESGKERSAQDGERFATDRRERGGDGELGRGEGARHAAPIPEAGERARD
jgi:hypothetical protein